jgi:hypothetical protein
MPDGSVYYGELEYMHSESKEIVYNFEELSDEQKRQHKIVRHGYGIQLFGRTEGNNLLCKYAGQWDRD